MPKETPLLLPPFNSPPSHISLSVSPLTMASAKADADPQYYTPIPPSPDQTHQPQPQNYVVLPFFYPSVNSLRPRRRYRTTLFTAIFLIILSISIYIFWPSDLELTIVRLGLHHVRVHTHPRLAVDISLAVTVRVRNRDFYSIDYDSLDVAIGYRGKELGHVKSRGGHMRARGSSYVDAIVEFDGVEVLFDWIFLLDDLAKGLVPFDTVTRVDGRIGLLLFELPLKAKISCEVDVNTKDQTIIHQNCYPERIQNQLQLRHF